MKNKKILLRKEEIEYVERTVQDPEETEMERKKAKEYHHDTSLTFYNVDINASREKNRERILNVINSMADLLPKVEKIEDKLDIEDLFIDEDKIFDVEEDLKEEDKKFILDLRDKTEFSREGNIYFKKDNDEKMKPVIKNEKEEDFNIEDVLLPWAEIPEYKIEEKMEQDLIDRKIKFKNAFS